jgi:hypothetical protein
MSGASKKLMSAAGAGAPTDEFFNQTTLLLHGDGTNGGQNNTFLDGSTNNFTITRNGNTTQGSFNPYGDRWSNFFDGTGDYLTVADATPLNLQGGDYTIELWFYWDGNASDFRSLVAKRDGISTVSVAWQIYIQQTTGFLGFYDGVQRVSSTVPQANSWNHVAAVWDNSTSEITLYLNGTSLLTSAATNTDVSTPISVGAANNGSQALTGYISDVRIVKGTALYTSAFTPPTEPLTAISGTELLTCQSNRFKDSSSNNFAITRFGDVKVTTFSPYAPSAAYSAATLGGSGYFDGTGDYLTLADNAAFALGSSDFTAECWAYFNSSVDQYFFGQIQSTASNRSFFLGIVGSKIRFEARSGSTEYSITAANNVVLNQWTHLAAVRNGNTITLYQDGTSIGTVDVTGVTISDSTNLMGVGSGGGYVAEPMNGYLSDVRLVVGTALYTAAFTPPTAPLTAVANTSLLCNFTNAAIFDSTAKNVLETVGDAQIDTSVVKYGTGSMEFDGSGDFLITPNNPDFDFGSGNFTIELWINTANLSSKQDILDRRAGASLQGWFLSMNLSAGKVEFLSANHGWVGSLRSNTNLPANSWVHIAVTRSGDTFRLFQDGIQVATNTSSGAMDDRPAGITIGSSPDNAFFNGYIDDLRITKGVARYTANFTPPDRAFPDQ